MLTALPAMLLGLNASRYTWASGSISAPVGTCQVSHLRRVTPKSCAVHTDYWPELALQDVANKVEGVRCRQHVNPLKKELQEQVPPQDWGRRFADPARPLVIDIGCGPGRFLLALAQRLKGHNMLGLDIKEKLVERASSWTAGLGLQGSVCFMTANATVSLGSMLSSYPGPLTLVTVQFPDPHFKMKHKKRRVIQPELVHALAHLMPPGGHIFLQSDVKEAAVSMYEAFREHGSAAFCPDTGAVMLSGQGLSAAESSRAACSSSPADRQHAPSAGISRSLGAPLNPGLDSRTADQLTGTDSALHEDCTGAEAVNAWVDLDSTASNWGHDRWPRDIQWRRDNPLMVPTEREVHTQRHAGAVYRALLVRY